MNNDNFINGGNNLNNNITPPQTPIDNLNNTSMQPQPNNNTTLPQTPINNLNNTPVQPQPNNNILPQNGNNLSNTNISGVSQFPQPNVENISQQPTINTVNNFASQPTTSTPQPQVNNVNSTSQNEFQNNDNVNPSLQQNISYISQPTNNSISINDEELLKDFIGNNYEKITTKQFNFAGFFFTTFYMFYRKMFLYAIILFLVNLFVLNVINNYTVTILFNVAVGFLVNKIYLYYAKKKIDKIKSQNSQKDINELKVICSNKGGTSVGKIFLGFFAEIGITLVIIIVMLIAGFGNMIGSLFNPDNWDITINGNKINTSDTNNSTSKKDATLVEDVIVSSYSCFGSQCTISIEESGNYVDYNFSANNIDLFELLVDYNDYLKVDIYYTQKGNNKTIVDYKIFLKSNNEDITNVKNEDELRNKIGLYSTGTYTELFTLTEIGITGFGYKDDKSYTYANYTLIDSKNNEYEMKYIIPNGSNGLNLVEGNKYNVTFEVVKDTFGYEFYIKSVN